jgi:hypothetical protein
MQVSLGITSPRLALAIHALVRPDRVEPAAHLAAVRVEVVDSVDSAEAVVLFARRTDQLSEHQGQLAVCRIGK